MVGRLTPFAADEASTPLTPDEFAGLKPTHVALRRELNELEAANILDAELWAFGRRHKNLLSGKFLLGLHKRMFGTVWTWAGTYRTTTRNLGVEPWRIQTEVQSLLDDARFWPEHRTYEPDECAIRFHHRLVAIHPFVNGNGRHSRMMADLIARELGVDRFSWGSANIASAGSVRRRYIQSLQAADNHDYGPLLAFARS